MHTKATKEPLVKSCDTEGKLAVMLGALSYSLLYRNWSKWAEWMTFQLTQKPVPSVK